MAASGPQKGHLRMDVIYRTRGPNRHPLTENPKATGGSGVAGEGDTSSLCPPTLSSSLAKGSRDTTPVGIR